MAQSSDYRPTASASVWLVYVSIALLAFSVLVWRMASLPLFSGRDTDPAGLALVAVIAFVAGLVTAATGALRWARERQSADGDPLDSPRSEETGRSTVRPG